MEQLPLDLGFPNPVAAAQKNAFFPAQDCPAGPLDGAPGGAEARLDGTPTIPGL